MRISDWSSDVCSSDLSHEALRGLAAPFGACGRTGPMRQGAADRRDGAQILVRPDRPQPRPGRRIARRRARANPAPRSGSLAGAARRPRISGQCHLRSEEHTSELQSLMRISYAVFCLKKKKNQQTTTYKIYE